MPGDRDLKEAIRHLAGTNKTDEIFIFDAEVESVDIPSRTCNVTSIGNKAQNPVSDVRLMSSVDDGILIIPTIGSTVTIILTNFTQPLIIQYSEVDKIILRGGDLGGMVEVEPLTKKLNNLEKIVNDLITKFNAHTHPVAGSLASATTTPETTTLTPTVRADIENINITQG